MQNRINGGDCYEYGTKLSHTLCDVLELYILLCINLTLSGTNYNNHKSRHSFVIVQGPYTVLPSFLTSQLVAYQIDHRKMATTVQLVLLTTVLFSCVQTGIAQCDGMCYATSIYM